MIKKIAGINGFGRFGLHLLKYWLDKADSSNFEIAYITMILFQFTMLLESLLQTLMLFLINIKLAC